MLLHGMISLQFAGYKDYKASNCSMWIYSTTEGYKENVYTMYTSLTYPVKPVHYEMLGFDSLLGSHYDKYEIDYVDYSDEMPPPGSFDIPEGLFFSFYVCLSMIHFQFNG